jgi:translocation and assembly module TamB
MRLVRTQTIRGALDGKLAIEDFGRAPKVNGELKARGFAVGAVEPGDATFGVKLEGRELSANAELVAKKGSAKLAWQASVDWGARVAPSAVVSRSVEAKLRRFELATLFPLVEGDVSELEGKVDADARMVDTKNGRDLRAQVVLSDGVLQIPAIGQRFHDIEARATLTNDDIRLTQLKARGLTGALTVSGRAKLREFELVEANARVQIAEKEMIPVTLEGVALGDAWGDAELRFARSADGTTALEAKLEKLHVVLPESAPGSVQDFEPAAHVNIGVVRRDGAFAAIPLQPIQSEANGGAGAATLLRVTLGNEVWVHQGEKLDARFRGAFAARLDEKQDFEGKIELAGGMLDVSGKRFEIETGTITFAGPVEEALITATARWDSPAGYAVYADFSGSVSDGKISLRSEPPLGNDEVLSLLLFGTPDGSVGAGSGDEASTAASIAGDTAAAGLNQLIGRFTNLDVSARVDTSTGSARPEIVVQLTPRLTARVTRALGEPSPGQSPDRTFFTLELRLRRRWSLATIVGDHGGTALEIVWRLRY